MAWNLICNYCSCNVIQCGKRPGESHEGVGRKKYQSLFFEESCSDSNVSNYFKEFSSFEKRFFQLLQMNVFSSNSQIPCKKTPQIQSQHQVPWTFRAISRTWSLGKLQLTSRLTDISTKQETSSNSDFFGRPKENRAPETTSEVQTLTELSEIKRNFRDFERLKET